jgi:ferredoxin
MSRRRRILLLDPTRCDGHGVCHELFPERVALDRWGYPVIVDADIPSSLVAHARVAVEECPRMALHLVELQP